MPDTENLINLAAVQTLRTSGTVHGLKPAAMPTDSVPSALYHY